MDWDGSGNIDREFYPEEDRDVGIKILASKFEDEFASQAATFENCMTLDSQTKPTNDVDINGHKLLNVSAGSASSDGVNFSQIISTITAGDGITVDDTDSNNPVISADYEDGFIKGGLVSNDDVTPDSLINISAVKTRSSDDTLDIDVDALDDLDITQNPSWASGTAPSLTDASIFVWAVYDDTTPYYILDDVTGSNIVPVKRRVGAFLTDGSDDIIPFKATQISGGGVLFKYDSYINDYDATVPTTKTDIDITSPQDMKVNLNCGFKRSSSDSGGDTYAKIDDTTNDFGTIGSLSYDFYREGDVGNNDSTVINKDIIVDSSSQVSIQADSATTVTATISTISYTDERTV